MELKSFFLFESSFSYMFISNQMYDPLGLSFQLFTFSTHNTETI